MIRTEPWWSTRTFSGASRPWATPTSCAAAATAGGLGDQPGGPARTEGSVAGEQDVQRGPGPPLVDDVAEPADAVGVEHPQDPAVRDGGRQAGRLEQPVGALVVVGDHVHGDVPLQDLVLGPPEATAAALVEEVGHQVATGEDVARPQLRESVGLAHPPAPFASSVAAVVGPTPERQSLAIVWP